MDVIIDFSVSLTLISFSVESKFIKDGTNKNVTKKETINPIVIIHPKIYNWFNPAKNKR